MSKKQRTNHGKSTRKKSGTDQTQFDQLLQRIAQQMDAGELAPAEAALRQILQQQPGNGFALYLLGVLAHRTGHLEDAVGLIEKAIVSLPKAALFRRSITEMYRRLGRLDAAIVHARMAIRLEPSNAVAHSNLGIIYYDRNEYDQALACQQNALRLDPNLPQALNNLGCVLAERGEREQAVESFRKVLEMEPGNLEARNNLGAVLTDLERPKEAVVELDTLLQAVPDYADAYSNLGAALLLLEQSERAEAAFRRNLELRPGNVTDLMGLARALKKQDRLGEAQTLVEQVLALEPDRAEAYSLSGEIHMLSESYVEAENAFHKALELNPGSDGAYLGLGQVQTELGRLDAASVSFEQAMAIDPNNIMPHIFLARIRNLSHGEPSLVRLEAEMERIDSLIPEKALPLHFVLGKTYDGLQEYAKAFFHFAEGCRLKRGQVQYAADDFAAVCANIMAYLSRDNIDRLRGAGDPSDMPIFVLGMPRSGTTLVETIIASHPMVHGAGELTDLLDIAAQPYPDGDSPGYPLSLRDVTQDALTAMGARYVEGVSVRADAVRHITDKNPFNFLALGLIHLIMPNAKIVHVRRNPLDTCLSGFTQLFNADTQAYSYDLAEIGGYYANYARLMEHWYDVLPDGAFCELQYEELVADKEGQIRRLIDYCGLEWNDACLESHKSGRSVKTASITQVRQPVYTSSVGRWRHYEEYLQPLLDALGRYASY